MHYLVRAIVIVLKTKRTYFVTPSVNSTSYLQFGQNMLSKSELLSLSDHNPYADRDSLLRKAIKLYCALQALTRPMS